MGLLFLLFGLFCDEYKEHVGLVVFVDELSDVGDDSIDEVFIDVVSGLPTIVRNGTSAGV